jgi:GTPase involved in cell partitioning and DNA repair
VGHNVGRGGSGGAVLFHADEALNTLAGLRSKVHVKGRPGDEALNTLAGLRSKVHVKGRPGKNGIGKNKDGSRGEDAAVRVPCGTIVRELYTQRVAGAGWGGWGNVVFKTRCRRSPG